MRSLVILGATLLLDAPLCQSHGVMTLPESTRQGGSIATAGFCEQGECLFFSHKVEIPGEPTVNAEKFRTFNVKVQSGPMDWTRKNPWRAPGMAPVFGSGCGSAGGGPVADVAAAAVPPDGMPQGLDGLQLPEQEPKVWHKGSIEEVAWGMAANHGGGYSYRLCPKNANISEACFQRHVLRFVSDKHWIQYGNLSQGHGDVLKLPRYEIPLVRVTDSSGIEWARNPIPACDVCDWDKCNGLTGSDLTDCRQYCAGDVLQTCPPGLTQFPEPLASLSGFTPKPEMLIEKGMDWFGFPFSVVDKVEVPDDLPAGEYLLSWRWDSEMTPQVWQNCADISLVDGLAEPGSHMEANTSPVFP